MQGQAVYQHSNFCNKLNPFGSDMNHHITKINGTCPHCSKPNPHRSDMKDKYSGHNISMFQM